MRIGTNIPSSLPEEARLPRAAEPTANSQAKKRETAIQGKSPAEEVLAPEEMEQTVEQLNQTTEAFNIQLRFKLHEASERIMVQVVDTESEEVIKEIPPEKLLNLAAQIQDMIGLLLDAKR
ncbi:MAG: flagellar protein FlaG [Bacillota bacterium]|nr:flagellar protein FlaG [Bacillota bacterium]MDW7683022.1 flagellar protein FlaG [Bacillota bacterium]